VANPRGLSRTSEAITLPVTPSAAAKDADRPARRNVDRVGLKGLGALGRALKARGVEHGVLP
jgi:hypothetical protein